MRKHFWLCHLFAVISLVFWGCASFLETERKAPHYLWSSFFNNDCGPMMQFKLNSANEAILNYGCSKGIVVSQIAKRHKRLNKIDLWAASDLPTEQLYKLSNSKCRASLIYLGPTNATIKFPCALIHMTVTCDIVGKKTMDTATVIQLKPTKALITYTDGFQEFKINERRLIPLGPFKPFKPSAPSLTHYRQDHSINADFYSPSPECRTACRGDEWRGKPSEALAKEG